MDSVSSDSFLEPIKPEVLRYTFGFDNPYGDDFDAFKILEPAINKFKKFAVGRFFWFIVDLQNWKHVCGGGEIETMTPLKRSDFFGGELQKLHAITHPDDLQHVMAFSRFWVQYFLSLPEHRRPWVNMSEYFRIQNAQHKYNWVMVQYSDGILDNKNQFAYGTVFVTDIAHLKKDGKPMLSILDLSNGNCQQFFCTQQQELIASNPLFAPTARQKQILNYLAIGYSSKQIACELNLSIRTVDNHRQNMLRKTGSKSTGELLTKSIMNGYL